MNTNLPLLLSTVVLIFSSTGLVGTDASQPDERRSMRIEQAVDPVFPPTQLRLGVMEGRVRIAVSIDAEGRLKDYLPVAYTHRSFADAVIAVLPEWNFTPMMVNGEYVPTQVDLDIKFEARGGVFSIDASSAVNVLVGDLLRGWAYAPKTLDELDRTPRPLTAVRPVYPETLVEQGVSGEAVVEFYIDESGAVRMPVVTRADFGELGYLAIEAVRQWMFEPPTCDGRPVITRARQTFNFRPGEG